MVAVPLGKSYQSNSGDVPEQRSATIYYGQRNQSAREVAEGLRRSASSPGTHREAQEGRGGSELPASLVMNSGQR
jgi:hypothetical protein